MLHADFPIFKRKINNRALVYLDNASTTQKPKSVINAVSDFYRNHNANIHRGIHTLSQEATALYENARDKVKKFIHAKHREEIIFTSGATEAINLVVWTWGHENIRRGDEILLTEMEHHSNLVPWQILAKKKGAKLKFIPLTTTYHLQTSSLSKLITKKTKIVSLTHISNVLGTINPIEKIIRAARKKSARVLIDGVQAGAHLPIDVQKLGCDFYVLSGHKMYGPTGVGILYGKKELLEHMPPYQTGGHMIKKVDWQSSTWTDLPGKFEAGTANVAGVIGLGAAIDFLTPLIHNPLNPPYLKGEEKRGKTPPLKVRGGWEGLLKHELKLTNYALKQMQKIPHLTIYGPQNNTNRIGVISFNLAGVPPHDLASLLDEKGIAIRTGHHCTMPLHDKFGIESSARVSLGIYNTKSDIDKFMKGLRIAQKMLVPQNY